MKVKFNYQIPKYLYQPENTIAFGYCAPPTTKPAIKSNRVTTIIIDNILLRASSLPEKEMFEFINFVPIHELIHLFGDVKFEEDDFIRWCRLE